MHKQAVTGMQVSVNVNSPVCAGLGGDALCLESGGRGGQPLRKGGRCRRCEKRCVEPKQGDRVLIRWDGHAAGSAPDGYYRGVLSQDPESGELWVYGRDRDARWWDDPADFERDEDDWKPDADFDGAGNPSRPPAVPDSSGFSSDDDDAPIPTSAAAAALPPPSDASKRRPSGTPPRRDRAKGARGQDGAATCLSSPPASSSS